MGRLDSRIIHKTIPLNYHILKKRTRNIDTYNYLYSEYNLMFYLGTAEQHTMIEHFIAELLHIIENTPAS